MSFQPALSKDGQAGKHRLTIGIAILADHYITAAETFKVVDKGAHSSDDRIWISYSLVLDALTFDGALTQ